jgi:hypothetical protein
MAPDEASDYGFLDCVVEFGLRDDAASQQRSDAKIGDLV